MKKENTTINNTTEITTTEKQEENKMTKQDVIEQVESTFDIVGAGRTISNYTGISDNEIESDYIEFIVRQLFGEDEKIERNHRALLLDYYKKQPEEFFEKFNNEDLVILMAEDMLSIRCASAAELPNITLKPLKFAPYTPEIATDERMYNIEMKFQRAVLMSEIIKTLKDLFMLRIDNKISAAGYNKLRQWCEKFGYGDWVGYGDEIKDIISALRNGTEKEDFIDFVIGEYDGVIRGIQQVEEEKQEEKEMAKYNKKQDVIDRVISTYEVVGRERTIHNCEGLDDDNDIEIFGRKDITVLAAEYIFGRSDAEAAENEQLLVSYYESQPERFFERLTTDDILGERLVTRMADALLDAKTQGAKLDEADRHMCGLNDRYSIRLYRAEFLNTYRKLDIRDDEMENYLANFQTQATAWDHMMSWDYPESGWRFLMNKFYGSDEGARYNWVDHVTDMVTWLRELMEIATVCGTYSPDNSYRAIDYTGYNEFCLETLDVRNSVEEKIHSYESRHPYAAPVPVRFEDVKEFVIKFRYVDLMKITDEIDQEISERPAWFRDEYGLTTGYYRAV